MTRLGVSPLVSRIALLLTGIFAAALIAAGTASWFFISKTYDAQLRREIAADAAELKQRVERLRIVAVIDAIDYRLAKSFGTGSDVVYLLVDAQGEVITGNLDAWPADMPPAAPWARFALFRQGESVQILAHMEEIDGHYWLLTGRTLASAERFQRAAAFILCAVGGLSILGSALLTILFSRVLAARFETVTQALEAFGRGDANARSNLQGHDEIARLSAGVDRLLVTVDRQLYHLRNISRVIAHEFRSPLSRVRSQLASIDPVPAAMEAELAEAQEELAGLLALSNQLLEIAEYESNASVHSEEVSLPGIVQRIASLLDPVAEERSIELRVDAAPAMVRGEPALLERLLANLLENALEATPPGGQITCACGTDASSAFLQVRDSGPGVQAQTLDELISQQAALRISSPQPGSHGIGLRLVRAIALRHGARVTLGNVSDGFAVQVNFP
ncbi:MAG: ATP-binding protein [Hyphomonadaceae bacterium]|nr:ATP-binding protein [Hyphomonadaceae bacterium]